MILVDTSVWIDHLRAGDEQLVRLLGECKVLAHPFVIGELAMGNLRSRSVVLSAFEDLPQAQVASEAEVLRFIEERSLHGMGIGYVDAHLLPAAILTPGALLWTREKRLTTASKKLGIAANRTH